MSDIVSFGLEEPRHPRRWRLIVAGAVVLIAGLAIAGAMRDRPKPFPDVPPPAAKTSCGVSQSMAGLVLELPGDNPARDLSQDRCDRTAADGPWTVVVRRSDGSLAQRGAVVTYPVAADQGRQSPNEFMWPLAGSQARIRGDLGAAGLAVLAERVTAVAGRPRLDPPTGYIVTYTGPYRAVAVQEAGYGSAAVAEQDALGKSWVHTGLADGGGFEDALYAAGAQAAPAVGGHPAVFAGVREGAALLCWELEPGRLAFVAYGGDSAPDAAAGAALHRLALHTRVLTAAEWRATKPVIVEQVNDDRHPGPWPVTLRE